MALLRHPSVQSPPGICYGRLDLPLAAGWQRLIPDWLRALEPVAPAAIRSSPLGRCRQPAEALAERLQIPMRLDARLLELDFGDWEGLAWDRVPRAALDRWAADPLGFAPPRGEGGAALMLRVAALFQDLAAETEPWLVVSHGGPLRLLDRMLRGERPDLMAPSPPMGAMRAVTRPRLRSV